VVNSQGKEEWVVSDDPVQTSLFGGLDMNSLVDDVFRNFSHSAFGRDLFDPFSIFGGGQRDDTFMRELRPEEEPARSYNDPRFNYE